MEFGDQVRRADDLGNLEEGVCLICGAAAATDEARGAPVAEYLHGLGWHCWPSRVQPMRNPSREVMLRICPNCLVAPSAVANTILARHGLAQMVDWLRSREVSA
jgi:hypothetical protein